MEARERELPGMLGMQSPLSAGAVAKFAELVAHWIPAGVFAMGSPAAESGREENEMQHRVELTLGFFLSQTACTQKQFESVMMGNPSNRKGHDLPVEMVDWLQAAEYCRKLTEKHRSEGILPEGWEWRLPTEAQWEYACRAGSTAARYGDLDSVAWYETNASGQTHPVGGKQANLWGLKDMLGNVSEWCEDWYERFQPDLAIDPTGPASGRLRVLRGGSWHAPARVCRAAFRATYPQDARYSNFGFRPALVQVRLLSSDVAELSAER